MKRGYSLPPRTEEHKRHLSEALLGRKCPWNIGNKFAKGYRHTTHDKEVISQAMLRMWQTRTYTGFPPITEERKRQLSLRNSGAGNPNWRGGVSNLPYSFKFNEEFKEKVREQCKRACLLCGMTEEKHLLVYGARLDVHHLTGDKGETDIAYFSALCKHCHGKQQY